MGLKSRACSVRISAVISSAVNSPDTYRSNTASAALLGSSPSKRTEATARATRARRSARSPLVIDCAIIAIDKTLFVFYRATAAGKAQSARAA
jgi:hypothetical protein